MPHSKNEEKEVSFAEIADVIEIANEQNFICLADTHELLRYNEGIYDDTAIPYIEFQVEQITKSTFTKHKTNEVIECIKRRNLCTRDSLLNNPDWICVQNGWLNILTRELKPHTPDWPTLTKLPVEYDPNKTCPAFLAFLEQVIPVEQDRALIQELFGYCLLRAMPFHKAFMLIGSGRNGKSTLLTVLRTLLGSANVTNISLQALSTNRFMPAQLYGKMANIFSDLPKNNVDDASIFKSITGGDRITAERKHGHPFEFVNYAKLVFSANNIPRVGEDSNAFFSRWIIINFPNEFSGEKADKNLLSRLTTPSELSGILNWSLDGFKRLLERQDFGETKTLEEVRTQYLRLSNPVKSFYEAEIELKPDCWLEKDQIFKRYVQYCRANQLPCVSHPSYFFGLFKAELPPSTYEGQMRVEKNGQNVRIRVIHGLNFSETVTTDTKKSLLLHIKEDKNMLNIEESRIFVTPVVTESLETTHTAQLAQLIRDNPKISTDELAQKLGTTTEVVLDHLASLATKGEVFEPQPDRWQAT